jgi:hypothetical protein
VASITLDPDDLERLGDLVAERILARVEVVEATRDHWMDPRRRPIISRSRAPGSTSFCAARTVPFEQDKPGGKRWFKADDLDAWRRRDSA